MDLEDAPESSNVEDGRGMGTKLAVGGAGSLLLLVLALIFGPDLLNPGPGGPGGNQGPVNQAPLNANAQNDRILVFTKKVLGTTEVVWSAEFRKMGKVYTPPHLHLFSDEVQTGCGLAPSAVGPFYCPADRKVYLDPTFFDVLEKQLGGSKGEFSQAYVIAHEVGHHVQNLLGYMTKRGNMEEHDFSVRLELQADYLAGVWAHYGQEQFKFIEPGDVDSAIQTANSIGDDRIAKHANPAGFAHPENYTHGTSKQRVRWFLEGLRTGDTSKTKLDHFFESRSSRDL